MPESALSVRKLIRVIGLSALGALSGSLAVLNLTRFDQQSRYFAAVEGLLAMIMIGALIHEIRIGQWRAAAPPTSPRSNGQL